ncbi:MAG: histone deacetylase family protein [Thermoprotei archaeon]
MKLSSTDLLGIIWDDRFLQISFSHPMIKDRSKERIRNFIRLARERLNYLEIRPDPASEDDLYSLHARQYVDKLKEVSKIPYVGFLDEGDTVHYPGIFEDVLLVLGASKTAIKYSEFIDKIYIPLGGFHHATHSRAMGFCPVNDVAYAALQLLKRGERVAIVDVDAHHGNGLVDFLYDKPILKINVFAYDGKFFPGTGKPEERGVGQGEGLNYNVGLPLGSGDDAFELALSLLETLEDFKPAYILVVAGVDGHKDDELKSLNLTCNSYNLLGLKVRRFAGSLGSKVIGYGGGGYGRMSAECMVNFLEGLVGKRVTPENSTNSDAKTLERVKQLLDYLKVSTSRPK